MEKIKSDADNYNKHGNLGQFGQDGADFKAIWDRRIEQLTQSVQDTGLLISKVKGTLQIQLANAQEFCLSKQGGNAQNTRRRGAFDVLKKFGFFGNFELKMFFTAKKNRECFSLRKKIVIVHFGTS